MMLPWLAHRGVGAGIQNDVIKAPSITFYVLKHNKRKKGKKLASNGKLMILLFCFFSFHFKFSALFLPSTLSQQT